MVEKQILRFEISVDNVELVKILDTSYDLVKEFEGLWLFDPLILDDKVE